MGLDKKVQYEINQIYEILFFIDAALPYIFRYMNL